MEIKKGDYLVNVMTILSLGAVLMKLLLSSMFQPTTLSIVSYSLIAMSIFTVMYIPSALKSKMKTLSEFNSMGFIYEMFKNHIPFFILIALLSWLVVINLIYSEQINSGNERKDYNSLSLASTIFILLQTYTTFDYLRASLKQSKGIESDVKSKKYLIYIFSLVNLAIIGSINIILEFFNTDG